MPAALYKKFESLDVDILTPLLRTIARKFDGMTILQAAEMTGIPNWKIGRILSRAIMSPSYVDITRLVVFAGLTPNEAASIVGLYRQNDFEEAPDDLRHQYRLLLGRLTSSGLDGVAQRRLLTQFDVLVSAEQLMQRQQRDEDAAMGH